MGKRLIGAPHEEAEKILTSILLDRQLALKELIRQFIVFASEQDFKEK